MDLGSGTREPTGATAGPVELTVVVPTFNESENIEPVCAALDEALRGVAWEAIFVDDDSPDGTAQVIRDVGRKDARIRCIRRVARRGLAGACVEGILAAQGPIVAVIDADLQHDAMTLRPLLDAIRSGADLAVASRFCAGASLGAFAAHRGRASRLANRLASMLPGVTTTDPMSGFFMARLSAVEPVAASLSTRGFKLLFDILATAGGRLRVVDVPLRFGERRSGESKLDARVIFDFAELVVEKVTRGRIPAEFVGFATVGLGGIAVHLVTLRLIRGFEIRFLVAEISATVTAMTFNFFLNNMLTYRDRRLRGRRILPGLLEFYAICGLGAVANVGVASWIFWGMTRWSLAGLAGSIVGTVWNFGMTRALVWNRP
jgi:dolichol-phosphate mannosyltransferase